MAKQNFQQPLIQPSVSHDPSEIIQIISVWPLETCHIIINVIVLFIINTIVLCL